MSTAFEELRLRSVDQWEGLHRSPVPRIRVGTATCGRAAGGEEVLKALEAELARRHVAATVTQVGCMGLCYAEPLIDIAKPGRPAVVYGNVTPELALQLVEDYLVNDNPRPDLALGKLGDGAIDGIPDLFELPMLKGQARIVLRNCGIIDPEDIGQYVAVGGFSGLNRALTLAPDAVIQEVKRSGLRGRGGAGFPTGVKWELCRAAPGARKYVVCNADEGDPGAFMNRSVLESDPFAVLEGMLIAAYAIGAGEGYVYVRAEYPLAVKRIIHALGEMQKHGLLGERILGSDFSFDIHVKEGAGAFVCGEETALMASIEGKRGLPRSRPPFPAQSGLWGCPTNINNVETLADSAVILARGGDWYAKYGSEKARGTKTFALVGKVNNTGLVEVPLGATLRQVIFGMGGGIVGGKAFKAVQTGGPSGGCLPAKLLDSPVDYDALYAAGSIMGSGGMVVMDQDTCMVDVARYFLSFTQSESCGKCIPCRLGTKQMLDILTRITEGKGTPEDMDLLPELAESVKAGSLCGLGQTAPNPALTTLRYFRDEYEAHIRDQRCPALVCKELVTYYILPDRCQACLICARNCPSEAIKGGKGFIHVIDQDKCNRCGACFEVCPPHFGAVVKVSGETLDLPAEPVPVVRRPRQKTTGSSTQSEG